VAGLASIPDQVRSINARLAALNPLRVALGLPSYGLASEPRIKSTDNTEQDETNRHLVAVSLRQRRLELDDEIAIYAGAVGRQAAQRQQLINAALAATNQETAWPPYLIPALLIGLLLVWARRRS
jgi:hypothetical protein